MTNEDQKRMAAHEYWLELEQQDDYAQNQRYDDMHFAIANGLVVPTKEDLEHVTKLTQKKKDA